MSLWINDPKDNNSPSVSLTLMLVSFLLAVVAISLNIAKVTDNTSSAMELFITASGIYLGRRFNFSKDGTLTADVDPATPTPGAQ